MARFSNNSKKILSTCDNKIQLILNEAIKETPIDFTVVCGYRGEKEQNEAFKNGFSKLKFPQGKHNKNPSLAVDIVPYPKMWDASNEEWTKLSEHIKKIALKLNIKIRWGGDWKTFIDKPHWEL